MQSQIFVNIAVHDLEKAKAFYLALGYAFNPQFTDETAACLVISEHIFAMLLTEAKMKSFIDKELVDAKTHTEALLALSCESKAEVDTLAEKAVSAGGREPRPASDYGFMYSRSFEDLDGHIWEAFWMDPKHVH